jgi:hypothetical protein
VRFLKASRNLSSDGGFSIPVRTGAPPPASGSRPNSTAQREDCAIPIVLMSSDRLFLGGLLASMARLRFTGTIKLPRLFQGQPKTGHFYFARNRTFLLCLDSRTIALRANERRELC